MTVLLLTAIVGILILATDTQQRYLFGLISDGGVRLEEQRAAGIEAQLVRLSWREWYPEEGRRDEAYLQGKKDELSRLREAGFDVVLDLGFHDTPPWVHENYDDTRYVDQHGREYTGDTFLGGEPVDNGDANLVFNDELRGLASSYIQDVFAELEAGSFHAVRLGGGRYGELTYPPASFGGEDNLYWAYDENAKARSPVPGWEPGEASPSGEAGEFLGWYLDALVEYQGWQVEVLRESGYGGRIHVLYPGWGIRPGQVEQAVASNLDGSTSAERNGEAGRGLDFERQVGALEDEDVLVTTTWLDADASQDDGRDPRYWSPVKYLYTLAADHPLRPGLFGENTGKGGPAAMELSASQMRRYHLTGMIWFREEELFSGRYASLEDYGRVIAAFQETGGG